MLKLSDSYWFTQDWVEARPLSWTKHLGSISGQPDLRFLEIGCFEGRATVWLLLNILTHPTARIDCVDVFDEEYEWSDGDYESRFDHNILISGFSEKVSKLRGYSHEVIKKLPSLSYECIYIDGSHNAVDVLQDAVLSFMLLKPGGIMIFDDYEWKMLRDPLLRPRLAVDAFLRIYKGQYTLLEKAYQVIIRKS